MAYKKIYYDDIWKVTSKGSNKCNELETQITDLNKRIEAFLETDSFKGQAATNMKDYLSQVHGILVVLIGTILQSYSVLAIDYYGNYAREVDSGIGGDEVDLSRTTIIRGEVSDQGSIQSKLNEVIRMAEQVSTDANRVKSSISDLVYLAASPKTEYLVDKVNKVKFIAQKVHEKAEKYENSRLNDFAEIDQLINHAKTIINAQLGQSRIPVIAYQKGDIGKMCDWEQMLLALEATSEKISPIVKNEHFKEDANLVLTRDDILAREEREWAQWAAVGFAVFGSVVLIAVTAGGATPLVCATVGAVSGAAATSSALLADEYVEKGHFNEMDWSDFGKAVVVAGVGGFVGGYLGTVSTGSAIKQPIKKAVVSLGHTALKEVAEGTVGILWEAGETAWEVGDAYISGKPGKDVETVLKEGLDEVYDEVVAAGKDITVEGAKSFVSGYVSGNFDIDNSTKSTLRKVGEDALENVAEEGIGGIVDTAWDVYDANRDNDDSTTTETALKAGIRETVSNMAGATVSSVVSEGVFSGVDDIDNKVGKIAAGVVKDTTSKTVEKVTSGVTERTMEYASGDQKDASKILGDIWEEDLDKGRVIAKEAGESVGKGIVEEVTKDQKLRNEMKKIAKDGKVEVVQFGDYAVTKQDYDAAVEVAGKGAYKDKTAQEILGLPHDTDLSSGKTRNVSYERIEKYTSDRKTVDTVTVGGKYVYEESYYDSAIEAAGKGEYKGKTAQDILGLPADAKLTKDNVTRERIDSGKIGKGKEVVYHKNYDSKVTKIRFTNKKEESKKDTGKSKNK